MSHFSKKETQCKCGCGGDITDEWRTVLDIVRNEAGEPLSVSSGFRCVAYDKKVGGKGVHPQGNATDIKCSGKLAHKVLKAAALLEINGIGISQKGPHDKRFIHLDDTEGPLRPWVWSY